MKTKRAMKSGWGIPLLLLLAAIPGQLQAQTLTPLYSFTNSAGDGAGPRADLIIDSSGNLYGTTNGGGGSANCGTNTAGVLYGCGTVFELVKNSNGSYTETVLYRFTAANGDGAYPRGLIMDSSGNLYGTTAAGGVSNYGTVFELAENSDGSYTETVLHRFTNLNGDGQSPVAGLIMDSAGNLYGTTSQGGTNYNGIVFELVKNTDGSYTEQVLHSFRDPGQASDGATPYAGLTMDLSGNLYGTTESGTGYSPGAVFELIKNSNGSYTGQLLHSFKADATEGRTPYGDVIMDSSGNLYGTTYYGGTSSLGVVFELVKSSNGSYTESVLHDFTGSNGDGAGPYSGLVMDSSGNLYGTTTLGGFYGKGTVFALVNSGGSYSIRVQHSFSGSNGDGTGPSGGLIMESSGILYGTTANGGTYGYGTVFAITPALQQAETLTKLTSSSNPVIAGDGVVFTVTLSSASGTPVGSVTLSNGSTILGTTTLTSGQATFTIEDAVTLGIGTYNLTAQFTPAGETVFSPSTGNLAQIISEPGVAVTGSGNTFTGNQIVNGTVTATSFSGNGSALTGIIAATANGLSCIGCVTSAQLGINYALGDAQGGNAMNAIMLGGLPPNAFQLAGSYATTGANVFSGDQHTTGNLVADQYLLANGATIKGPATAAGGFFLPPTKLATPAQGYKSNPFDIYASVFDSAQNAQQAFGFIWQAEPVASSNNTAAPAVTLNLLAGPDAFEVETGLSVNLNGTINFAAGQTFPGAGTGTISGVTAGTGLSGGGSSGNVSLTNTGILSLTAGPGLLTTAGQAPTLSLDKTLTDARYLQLAGGTLTGGLAAPSFAGNGGALTNLNPANLNSGTAAINITGNANTATSAATATTAGIATTAVSATTAGNAADLGGVAAADYARLDIGNSLNGDQKVIGNLSVTGTINGTLTIGSSGTPIKQHLSVLVNPSFPAILPFVCVTANFTVAGASDGNTVALGVPNSRMNQGGHIIYTAWVSAANTVTIQACNIDSLNRPKAAGSGLIRIDLWMY